MASRACCLGLLVMSFALPHPLPAKDLFVSTVGGGGNTATLSGNTFRHVINDTIDVIQGNLLLSPTGGAYADLGDHYTSPHLRVGTGWQF